MTTTENSYSKNTVWLSDTPTVVIKVTNLSMLSTKYG